MVQARGRAGVREAGRSARGATAVAVALCVSVLVALLGGAVPAQAKPNPDPGVGAPAGIFTELTITGFGAGQAVAGFRAPAGFDPLAGYPATVPPGSTPDDASFAGTIQVTDPVSGQTTLTYCIDLATDTQTGVHYQVGSWTDANVPLLGYISYILTHYFPLTGEPAGATSNNQRAAAVQAAIWFFSDGYVLATTDAARGLVGQIVADALANGPQPEPVAPQLQVAPTTLEAPATGEIVGPFTVTSDGPSTIRSFGVEVFADQQGTTLLPDGSVIQPGATLWARSTSASTPQGFVLDRQATILESTVYLYDGSNAGRDTAQKLVLAQPTELDRRAGALLQPFAAGALEVVKTIDGAGAGLQSDIVLTITCTPPPGSDLTVERTVTIPAGTPAGEHPQVVGGLPAEATCTVTETQNGDNGRVVVTGTTIAPSPVIIVNGGTVTVDVTDTYDVAVGSLQVTKSVTGAGAGSQGEVTLTLTCDDAASAFDRVITFPARLGAGTHEATVVTGIPAGTRCTVAETAGGGATNALLVATTIEPATAEILEDQTATVLVTNTYDAPAVPTTAAAPTALAASGTDAVTLALLAALVLAAGLTTTLAARRR